MWQDYWDHDWLDPDEYVSPWHYEGRGLDDPMPFSNSDIWWDFRMVDEDGNRWYPSPREVLSNEGPYMSVRYQNDYLSTLLPGYEPNPNLFQSARGNVRVKCRDRGWSEWWRTRRGLVGGNNQTEEVYNSMEADSKNTELNEEDKRFAEEPLGANFKHVVSIEQHDRHEAEIKLAVPENCRLGNKFSRQSDQDKCKIDRAYRDSRR